MRSVKELRRKAAKRAPKKAPVYSTSEARANFAEALETAQVDSAVIGFDRYGRTVAVLVPVEAAYILAGLEREVSPAKRAEIKRAALLFVRNVPNRIATRSKKKAAAKKAKRPAAKKKPAKRRAKRKSLGATP
jgi:hypothetical protein